MSELSLVDLKLADDIVNNSEKKKSATELNLVKFQKTILVENIRVDLICIEYSNKILISISTNGKFGSALLVKPEQVTDDLIFTVKTLFGQEESILQVFARNLGEQFNSTHSVKKPLLISFGVDRKSLENIQLFRACQKAILHFYNGNV